MSTRIESVATTYSRPNLFARGALRLSDAAARACLERAGRQSSELDLLVNAGLYKEDSMAEPALASIIQEDIGAGSGRRVLHSPERHLHDDGRHGTFSFDVMNGGCGVLSGFQLVDGFVGRGTAQLGLVVAADADPAPHVSRGFPFRAVGGAVLLRHDHDDDDADDDDDSAGSATVNESADRFVGFDLRTFPEHANLFESRLQWEPELNKNIVEIREDPSFARRCVECAVEVTIDFLFNNAGGLFVNEIDLLIASQYPPSFANDVATAIGLPPDRVPIVPPELARAHTAGVIVALDSAMESGAFSRARRILFLTAGAGITIGACLYERRPTRTSHTR